MVLCSTETVSVKWRPLEETAKLVMGNIAQWEGDNMAVERTESIGEGKVEGGK